MIHADLSCSVQVEQRAEVGTATRFGISLEAGVVLGTTSSPVAVMSEGAVTGRVVLGTYDFVAVVGLPRS